MQKPQTTELVPQGPYHTSEIYSTYREELDAIAQEPSADWRHIEQFVWSKGYIGGIRPARMLQYTFDHMEEYKNYTSIRCVLILDSSRIRARLSDKLTDIDKELLNMECDAINDRNDTISDEEEELFEPDEASPCAEFCHCHLLSFQRQG